MGRPLRIEYEGAVYHVTARSNARSDIYLSDSDRDLFLDVLAYAVDRCGWICHAGHRSICRGAAFYGQSID